jgi:hypothetical protein
MNTKIDQIRELAARYSGQPIDHISEATRIFHDLALDGDDAEEFLFELFTKFELPTEDFPFGKYFGSEVGAGWRHLLMVRLGVGSSRLAPLTVGQLASWAEAGSVRASHAA